MKLELTKVLSEVCYIDLHYRFSDHSHSMDAVVQNKCELDFLRLLETIGHTCRSKLAIEIEPRIEGGLINRYKLKTQEKESKDKNVLSLPIKIALLSAVFIAPTTIVVNSINEVIKNVISGKMGDPVIDSLEKEKLKLEIEKIHSEIQIQKETRLHDSLRDEMLNTDISSEIENFRWYLIKLNKKSSANDRRLKSYKKLANYEKIDSVSMQVLNKVEFAITPEFVADKREFIGLATDSSKQIESMEDSVYVSIPVLSKRANVIKSQSKWLSNGDKNLDK